MSRRGGSFKRKRANPTFPKRYEKPPATLEEYEERAKGVDCGGLPPEVGWHVSKTKRLQPAVRTAVLIAYLMSKKKNAFAHLLDREDVWFGVVRRRQRDAAVAAARAADCDSDSDGSSSTSASSDVSSSDATPLRKGSSFSIAVLRLLLSFITILPFRCLSTRTIALQFNGWCERNGLGVPSLNHVAVHRAVRQYIPQYLGVDLDLTSLLFSPKRLKARVADMWWAYAEALFLVPPSEHEHMARGRPNLTRWIWMDECPVYLRKTRGATWGVKGFKASGEGAGGRLKMTLIMAVCSTGILKMKVVNGGCTDKDYEKFMVGEWNSRKKRFCGGLLDLVRGKKYQWLVQDNLGRAGKAKKPDKQHFNRRVRCEFQAEGIRVEHVPAGGCVFNPIEPMNYMVQQWIAAWDNKGKMPLHRILGPTTKKEMWKAVRHCFEYYTTTKNGKKNAAARMEKACDARALGRDAVFILMASPIGRAVRALRDEQLRWDATPVGERTGSAPVRMTKREFKPVTEGEKDSARKNRGKKVLPKKRYYYAPLEANEAGNEALKKIDDAIPRLEVTEADLEEHVETLAKRKRKRMRGRPPNAIPSSDAFYGGNVSVEVAETVLEALENGLPCMPCPTVAGAVGEEGAGGTSGGDRRLHMRLDHVKSKYKKRRTA